MSKLSKLRKSDETPSPRRDALKLFVKRSVLTVAGLMVVLPSTGCATRVGLGRLGFTDTLLERYRDTVWARRAFNLRYNNCDIEYASHFEDGFVAGYCDTCNGGDGYVPALPPAEYRGYEFQSPDGAQCVKAWFGGFPAGVAAAKKDRAGEFHDIYTSKMINSAMSQAKAKHVLPGDVPVTKKSDTTPPAPRSGQPVYRQAKLANTAPTPAPLPVSRRRVSETYVSPPEKSPNPILNPNSIKASDLVPAPEIKKSGPMAMKPASRMGGFTIDPSVAIAKSPVATPAKTAPSIVRPAPQSSTVATLPPIVSGPRTGSRTASAQAAAGAQTPLPMYIKTQGTSGGSLQR